MLHYRLTKTLNLTQELQWQSLAKETLGESVHPNRVSGFCLAREALRLCFLERKITLEIPDLVLKNYSAVKGQDLLTVSLSHTPQWGAAIIGDRKNYVSVGIDIEPLQRVVKPTIVQRISHPDDSPLSPIALWSVKEASFKALMNTEKFEKPVEFSSLKILQGEWIHEDSQIRGEWKLEDHEEMIVALAWIKI